MTDQEVKDKIDQLVVFWEKDYRDREKSNSVGDALSHALWELAEWMQSRIKSESTPTVTISKARLEKIVKDVLSNLDLKRDF
jgi:hypothetical protein